MNKFWHGTGPVARVGSAAGRCLSEFLAAGCQPNTVRAAASDLEVFFVVVAKCRIKSGRPMRLRSSPRGAAARTRARRAAACR